MNMPALPKRIPCPACGEMIPEAARRCRHCREELADTPANEEFEPTHLIIPLNVSIWSLLSCYLGLLGCVPLVGLLFAIPAFICGVVAMMKRKQAATYGA